jgi:two-component system chemotaxis sensor kinase CheA
VPSPTLDQVASLLVQLEPGDAAGARELHAALRQLLRIDAFISPTVLPSLAAALRRVEAASHPEGGLAQADIDDIGRLIADAMRLVDVSLSGSFPAVAPPQQPAAPAYHHPSAPAAQPAEAATGHQPPVESAQRPPESVARPAERRERVAICPITLPDDADLPLVGEFVGESREYLEAAEAALLALESEPDDAEAVNTIFRAFHTIKGTSGFLALDLIADFAHHAENVLSRVREREIRCTGGYADLALRSVDVLKALLDGVQRVLDGGTAAAPREYGEVLGILQDPEAAGVSDAASAQSPDGGDENGERGEMEPAEQSQSSVSGPTGGSTARDTSVRVRTDRLDLLIDMVGELVIAQSMIQQDELVVGRQHHELSRKVSHAGKIVRELQDLSMGMRMVPLRGPFQKVARVVRDVAAKAGKSVAFLCEGEEVEIDRNLVDFLSDPLVHMVRNAVDHGIEPPAAREAAGKPRSGTVRLSAYHAGGNVVVELRDDGRGLDRQRILAKAVKMGLVDAGANPSDAEVYNLIFAPGFSTAEVVTDVSGRGVGMDVVRRNIERLRGRIEITSTPGKGTTFTVRLPLTLAITDGMLVQVGAERYIVPLTSIQLSFRPERAQLSTIAGRAEMVMLRGEIIPLVRLHRLFDVSGAKEDATDALLMLVGDEGDRIALLVDELLGQQQVVAKPLGHALGSVRGVSGSAILGDGRVGLILDVPALVAVARSGTCAPSETTAPTLAVA